MAESPSDRSKRRHRARSRGTPPIIDLKATAVAEPDPAMAAAASAMADPSHPAPPPAEAGAADPPDAAGTPADAASREGASGVASPTVRGPSEAAPASDPVREPDPVRPDEAAAQPDLATVGSPESLIAKPATNLDEKLIETAETNGRAVPLETASALGREPPITPVHPEPVASRDFDPDEVSRGKGRGYGLGALLAATALSGLLGAGLVLLAAPFLRAPDDRVRARLEQVERQVGALAPADAGAVERRLAAIEPEQRALAERVTRLQSQVEAAAVRAEAAAAPAAAPSGNAPADGAPVASQAPAGEALEPLTARLAALEGEVRARTQPGSDGFDARLAQQGERVASLETRLTQGLEPLAGMSQQITKQAEQLSQQGQTLGQMAQRLTQLDQTLAGQTQKLEQADKTMAGRDEKLGQIDQNLGSQTQLIATQGQRLAGLEKQFAERSPDAMAAGLRVVASDRVIDALRDGAPFLHALAALRRLNPNAPSLAPLEPFATTGAPTAAALAEEFRPLGQNIVAAARGPASDVTDRLWRMAEGVVAVRPVAEAGTTTVPGLVARIENALERGALQDAAAAWDALPEASRQASEAWGRKLKARAAADAAARTISAEALASLDAAAR